MEYCIYYKSKKLNFGKKEHIIPAALGGIHCMPYGYVSNEANNDFSKREGIALHNTPIAGIRNYIGPGSRGRKVIIENDGLITCTKGYNPHVQLLRKKHEKLNMKDVSEENSYKLGFMYDKNALLLPQIIFKFDSNLRLVEQIYSPGGFVNEFNNLGKCVAKVYNISESELERVPTEFCTPTNILIIGGYNKSWYYHMSIPLISLEKALQLVNDYADSIPLIVDCSIAGEYDFSYKLEYGFTDPSFQFLHLKTAFNVLANKEGQELVLESKFDNIRNLIVGDTQEFIIHECNDPIIREWIQNRKEYDAHIIIIRTVEKRLIAYVSFYGEMVFMFEMAEGISKNINFAYICDWKNKREYPADFLL